MRHRKKVIKLGRKTAHRKAMLANMASSLIEHKRINTTLTNDTDLGYINWSKKNDTDVILSSCWKTPCNNTSNYEEITINVKQ